MTQFEEDFFKKEKFSPQEIARYYQNALRDLEIAQKATLQSAMPTMTSGNKNSNATDVKMMIGRTG